MTNFDYEASAELFVGTRRGSSPGSHMKYKRFPTSAEAIKYAVEMLEPIALASAALVVEEDRYGGAQIRELYDGKRYPLSRIAA
jgi:hypothetical protein